MGWYERGLLRRPAPYEALSATSPRRSPAPTSTSPLTEMPSILAWHVRNGSRRGRRRQAESTPPCATRSYCRCSAWRRVAVEMRTREVDLVGCEVDVEVVGPWSLATSRAFWEGFSPAALVRQVEAGQLRSVFCAEGDWRRVEVQVSQEGSTARLVLTGEGDLEAAQAHRRAVSSRWMLTPGRGRASPGATKSWPRRRSGCLVCDPAASTRRTRPPRGRC